jgi:hypothetical protein
MLQHTDNLETQILTAVVNEMKKVNMLKKIFSLAKEG